MELTTSGLTASRISYRIVVSLSYFIEIIFQLQRNIFIQRQHRAPIQGYIFCILLNNYHP